MDARFVGKLEAMAMAAIAGIHAWKMEGKVERWGALGNVRTKVDGSEMVTFFLTSPLLLEYEARY